MRNFTDNISFILTSNFDRERYYKGIQEDSRLSVKLTGNWETVVGVQDTFVHILEYENYAGYDKATQVIRNSEAGLLQTDLLVHSFTRSSFCSILTLIKLCYPSCKVDRGN